MGKKKRREIPNFELEIFETHCHLDYLKSHEIEELLQKCRDLTINKIVTISVEPSNLAKVIQLADDHEMIYTCQGIHPHEAKDYTDDVEATIKQNLSHEKVLAVGEVGLDYYYNHSPHDTQRDVFRRQMNIAIVNNLPVIIHSRDAEDDTIAILDEFSPKLERKGVIHSFTSKPELAKNALENGFYLGFNGIITFKNAQDVRDAVELAPLDRILIETDAPFLTPEPYRGRENAPIYLPFIAEKISEIKNVPVEEVIKVTTQNAKNLFSL
jgi:TatD DNase family protein